MQKKKIALFQYVDAEQAEDYRLQIQRVFSSYAKVYSFTVNGESHKLEGDVIVTITYAGAQILFYRFGEEYARVVLRTNYTEEALRQLRQLPAGTRVALKAYEYNYAVECIDVLKHLGIRHLDFSPYSKETEQNVAEMVRKRKIRTLVYHGANDLEEKDDIFQNKIHLGTRQIIASSYYEIAKKLDIPKELIVKAVEESQVGVADCIGIDLGALLYAFGYRNSQRLILNELPFGILCTDIDGCINVCNKKIGELFSLDVLSLLDRPVSENYHLSKMYEFIDKSMVKNNLVYHSRELNLDLVLSQKELMYMGSSYLSVLFVHEYQGNSRKGDGGSTVKPSDNLNAKYTFGDIAGQSREILTTIDYGKKCALINAPVLILGETGVGKELYAHAIHNESVRRNKPFVAVNCTAIPDELLESELFGYEQGTFTGASTHGKKGLFQIANGGTIFLDEIGDASLSFQMKLLRVLQEKEITKLGSYKRIPVDVRIIAATNKAHQELQDSPRFRKDLFYRLSACVLKIPALKERREDIPLLAKLFLNGISCGHKQMSAALVQILKEYNWDGNVRELRNCVEQMGYFGGAVLTTDDLPMIYRRMQRSLPRCSMMELHDLNDEEYYREEELQKAILTLLKRKNYGRRKLADTLIERGFDTSEHEVRKLMDQLVKEGKIVAERGRGGSHLVKKG